MTTFSKWKKRTKINSRIISKPHAHLQTMEKTYAKFQKDRYKIYEELRSPGTHCQYTFIESKVRKWQSSQSGKRTNINAGIISKVHAHLQTTEKTCARFQKDWYKLYEELRSQGTHYLYSRKSDNKNLTIIYKPHAHPHTMKNTSAKFQKDRYKTVRGVALTRHPG